MTSKDTYDIKEFEREMELINKPKKKIVKKNVETNKKVETAIKEENKKTILVCYATGASYTTGSGVTFSQQNRIQEISAEEGELLLRISNFRLPNAEETEMYYTNSEV